MGVLNDTAASVLDSVGVSFKTRSTTPDPRTVDFPEGLRIIEIIDGVESADSELVLVGQFMPHVPFEFGGTQQIVKEYYAGSSSPTVQVLGARENDVVIRGRLKTKFFKDTNLRQAAEQYQEALDDIRKRGNLLKVTLGEWKRYAFLEESTFKLNRLVDIEYELKLSVIGDTLPTFDQTNKEQDDNVTKFNKQLSDLVVNARAKADYPAEMPKDIGDVIAGYINDVAEVMSVVTNFVDGIVSDVEKLESGVNRALGLVKYARSYVSTTKRRIGSIVLNSTNLGSSFSNTASQAAAEITNSNYLFEVQSFMTSFQNQLAEIRAKFAALSASQPLLRHLVVSGETLQRISMKYYGTAENWQAIYNHNKLSSTALQSGTVLEIPRV
jgi:LysM repeat protein